MKTFMILIVLVCAGCQTIIPRTNDPAVREEVDLRTYK